MTAVLVAVNGTANYLVDPYFFFESPLLDGFNRIKPATERLAKASYVRALRPKAVFLGNSRANTGIDPYHRAWPLVPFNLTQNGASIYEMERYLEHTVLASDLRLAVMSLDFTPFNVNYAGASDFNDAFLDGYVEQADSPRASLRDVVAHLVSFDTSRYSLATVRAQRAAVALDDVQSPPPRERRPFGGGQRRRFLIQERQYIGRLWFPPPARAYSFEDPGTGRSTLRAFATAVELSRQHGVDLRMFITPVHARLSYSMYASGLWPAYETWKRELARIVAADARRRGAAPFPLWDFSGLSAYTAEAVPPPGDTRSLMRWYHESSHYHADLGDLVLQRVFGDEPPSHAAGEAFGVLLNAADIEHQLEAMRHGLVAWMGEHPEDVAEIDALVASVHPARGGSRGDR